MADSVFKLVVDSKEYDSKIQRATSGLMAFEKKCREVGGTLEFVEKEDLDFVKALGQMETVSSSATGKLGELKRAFTELSVQYKNLTDAEKSAPYGRALAASLDQLKGRIKIAQSDLSNAQGQMTSLGDALQQLGGRFGIPVSAFSAIGAAGAAMAGAIKLTGDAIKQNEPVMDEWGRTVQSAQTLYESFLSALNNGDVSGFLSRISEIVSGARRAYDAMDELGTFTAFNQRNVAKGRANYAQALDAYRLNPTAENKKTLSDANERVMQDLRDSHDYTEKAYQEALRSIAEGKLKTKDLQDAFVKAFSEGNYAELQTLKASYSTGTGLNAGQQYFNGMRTYGGRVDESGSGRWRDMTEIEKQQFEFARALSQTTDEKIREVQALGAQAVQITEQIYQQDRAYNRLAGNNAPLRSGASAVTPTAATDAATMTYAEDSIKAQEAKVAELTKLWKEASAELRDGYYAQLQKAKSELEEMTKGPLTELKGQMSFAVEPVKIKVDTSNLKLAKNDAQGMREAFSAAASAVATVGGALQQIEDPAAKVAGIIAAAIAQVALTFASSLKGTIGPWDWIAAATAGLATMITTITAIKSVTANAKGYANGGIVEGNSYSGDNIVARLNAGEGVLTKTGIQSAAAMANGLVNGGGGGSSQPYLTGDVILLGVNNYLGRSGQGEIVTTSMLRRAGVNL